MMTTCRGVCEFSQTCTTIKKMSSNHTPEKAIEAKDLLDVCLKWQKYKHKEGKGGVVSSKSSSKEDVKKQGWTKRSSASREDVDMTERVIHVQKKRLEEYEVFENALVALLRSELKSVDVQKYQNMTSAVTKRFSALSNQVRKIVSSLSSRKENENETSDTYLRDTVRNIQNMEREKLHMVARYHLLRLHEKQGSLRPEDKPSIELLASSINAINRDLALRSADLESFANLPVCD